MNLLHALTKVKIFCRHSVAHITTWGNTVEKGLILLSTSDPLSLSFQSKGLKTDKLPAHTFEIDEDAKDEVSREARALLDRRHRSLHGRMSAMLIDSLDPLWTDCATLTHSAL